MDDCASRISNDPKECLQLLQLKYAMLSSGKVKGEEWEVWSGIFNRHIRKMISEATHEEAITLKYIFSIWQSYNRTRQYHFWDVLRNLNEENNRKGLIEAFNDSLSRRKKVTTPGKFKKLKKRRHSGKRK